MLRRRVIDVALDLPELVHIPHELEMGDSESLGYEALRTELLTRPGGALQAMTPLRMWCCHPRLRSSEWLRLDLLSPAKFARLVELLLDIRRQGEKALVFTSFNGMAELISGYFIDSHGAWVGVINGDTPPDRRQSILDDFTGVNGHAILVLNPQAAGVGLNIQAASHVIHYNLEWNPAVEEQATARAYRSGQQRPVRAHRMYYRDTIEEVINLRVELKRRLIAGAVRGVTGEDAADFAVALSLSPKLPRPGPDTHLLS
jgi:SNF2 family DNA or RNA helicase